MGKIYRGGECLGGGTYAQLYSRGTPHPSSSLHPRAVRRRATRHVGVSTKQVARTCPRTSRLLAGREAIERSGIGIRQAVPDCAVFPVVKTPEARVGVTLQVLTLPLAEVPLRGETKVSPVTLSAAKFSFRLVGRLRALRVRLVRGSAR